MSNRRTESVAILGVTLGLAAVFYGWPSVDLWAASLFFSPDQGFVSPDHWWLALPYYGMPRLAQATFLVLVAGFIASFWAYRWKARRPLLVFLLLGALMGPHLMVGEGLKEHFGRARPANISEFGGVQRFTPAFVLSDQCSRNCAFVSAHVASAAFVMAFGWLSIPLVRRRWLWASVVFAGVIGLARMAQGGHFLSDVVFAWLVVYWSLWLTEGGLKVLSRWSLKESTI